MLVTCWAWFVSICLVAVFAYSMTDFEWWILFAAAFAGLYGLRPNLERAIDTAWLQGVKTTSALSERVAQLRPIKRKIDLYFSLVVLVLFMIGVILYFAGVIGFTDGVTIQ